MSDIIEVSSDWLALRESEDARARSRDLATAAAARLIGRPIVVHDLGSGTGSMMRWLAPLLPGPQHWVLHDWNAKLTEQATDRAIPLDRESHPVSIESRTGDLASIEAADLDGASLVTASALLDVLTSTEVHAIVVACIDRRVPALLSLSVTGRVSLTPRDAADDLFESAFNAHQRRGVGERRMLGPYAPMIARGLFLEAGWKVDIVDSVWRLGTHPISDRDTESAGDPRHLLREWWNGWIDAACEQQPELRDDQADYLRLRRSQLDRGQLSAIVHHTDLLAWPS